MKVEIVKGPGNAAATVALAHRETCVAEGGAMIAYRGSVSVETATHPRKRSILGGLKRTLGGESFFLNFFTATSGEAEILFSSSLPGDMVVIEVGEVGIIAEGGAFVVRSSSIELDMSWQGMKSLFSGESLFWLRMSGQGLLVLNAFGAIYPIDVDGEYIVDTGHIVAFEETLGFLVVKGSSVNFGVLDGCGASLIAPPRLVP
jgi:uncharacterized protein (TIGR00266 family)